MVDGKKILGIDLGTTNSSAAVFYGGEARIVKPDDEGEFAYNLNSIASCVVLDENGDVEYVGNPAKEEALLRDDKFVITNFKRKIGEGEVFKFPNKIVTLEEVASEIIRQLKETAERNFDITLDEAIFSVPVYFTNNQKEAIKYAAELAGLNVRRLIPEPISAYVDYNYSNENQEDMGRFLVNNRFLVFDMGGGTLDISIIDYPLDTSIIDYYSTERNIPELSRGGDNNLGGEDMNDRIFDYVVNKFKEETNIDIREEGSISPLKREVEKAKIYLSTHQEYRIILPNIAVDSDGKIHSLDVVLTRDKLEELIEDLIDRCKKLLDDALDDANLTKEDIDTVLLVGGPSRMPIVKEFINSYMGEDKIKRNNINHIGAMARGAAIFGEIIKKNVFSSTSEIKNETADTSNKMKFESSRGLVIDYDKYIDLKEKYEDLKKKHNNFNKEFKNLYTQYRKLGNERSNLNNKYKNLKEKYTSINDIKNKLSNDIKNMEEREVMFKNKINNLTITNENLRNERNDLKKEVDGLKRKLEFLEDK